MGETAVRQMVLPVHSGILGMAAVMAVLDHHEFLGTLGLKLLAVIMTGTLIVMVSTALPVALFFRLRTHHDPA